MYIIIVIQKKMFNETMENIFQSLSLSRTTKNPPTKCNEPHTNTCKSLSPKSFK